MANWRVGTAAPAGQTFASGTKYVFPLGYMLWSTTSGAEYITNRIACTLKGVQVYLSANTLNGASNIRHWINGATGTCNCSVAASGTGMFEDSSNTDTLATGATWGYVVSTAATSGTGTYTQIGCAATGTAGSMIGSCGGESQAVSLTRYSCPIGYLNPTSTEAKAQVTMRSAVTLSRMSFYVSSNTLTAATTVRSRIDAVNGNQALSIAASGTGRYEEDDGITDVLSAGQKFCYSVVTVAGGTSIMIRNSGVACTSTTGIRTGAGTGGSATLAFGVTRYMPIYGSSPQYPGSTEAPSQVRTRVAGGLKNGFVSITSNSINGTSTFKTRKNTADGNIVVSVTASATGFFEDQVNTDSFDDDDYINFVYNIGGTSGTIMPTVVAVEFSLSTANTSVLTESMTLSDILRRMPGKVRSDSVSLSDVLRRTTQSYRREILRLRDVEQALYLRVTGSADSCRRYYDSTGTTWYFELNSNYTAIGYVNTGNQQNGNGFRFTGVNIPKDATLIDAKILITASDNRPSSTASAYISCENTDNAGVFTDASDFVTRYGNKTSTIDWANIEAWTLDTEYYSIDCKAALQTIINRSGWTEGNAVVFFVEDFDGRSTAERVGYTFASASAKAPRLYVRYLVPTNAAKKLTSKKMSSHTISLSDVITKFKTARKTLSDTITLTQQTLKRFVYKKVPGHSITLTQGHKLMPMKRRSETITLTQQPFYKTMMKRRTETITLTQQALKKVISRIMPSHTITLTDVVRKLDYKRVVSHTITMTQGFLKMPMKRRSESISLTDVVRKFDNKKIPSETITLSDIVRKLKSFIRTESMTLTQGFSKMPMKKLNERIAILHLQRGQGVKDDFEWGSDGDDIPPYGGTIPWSSYVPSGTIVEIDTSQKYAGTRSVRLYDDNRQYPFIYWNSVPKDFERNVKCRARAVNGAEWNIHWSNGIRQPYIYRDGSWGGGDHIVVIEGSTPNYTDTGFHCNDDTWYLIELRNIDWTNGRFDLWVEDAFIGNYAMYESGSWQDYLIFGGCGLGYEWWFDDVEVIWSKPKIVDLKSPFTETITLTDILRRMGAKVRSESITLTQGFSKTVMKRLTNYLHLSDTKIFKFDDFEWGSDGDMISTSQGSVTWGQYTPSGSYAEIDTAQFYQGTRSAYLSTDVWCSISTSLPAADLKNEIEVMIRRGVGNSRFVIYHGNGSWLIHVGCGGDGNTYYVKEDYDFIGTGFEYMASGVWYKLRITDIDFTNHTYKLWVGDQMCSCLMDANTGGQDVVSLECGNPGEIWYDNFMVRDVSVKKNIFRRLSESISLSDWVQAVKATFRTLTETINLSDILTRLTNKIAQETVTLSDWVQAVLELIQVTLSETINLTDTVIRTRVKELLEQIGLSDVDITRLFMKRITEEMTINTSIHRWIEGYSDDVGAEWRTDHWEYHNLDWPDLYIGYLSTLQNKDGMGLRFTSVGIPVGANITSARLRFTDRYGNSGTGVCSKITGEKSVDGATFSDWDNFMNRRGTVLGGEDDTHVFIDDQITWDNVADGTPNVAYYSPDIKTIIQKIIDQPAWTGMYGGNTVVLYWDDFDGRSTEVSGTCRVVSSFNDLGVEPWPTAPESKRPNLHVEFETTVPVTKLVLKVPFTEGINLSDLWTHTVAWARELTEMIDIADMDTRFIVKLLQDEYMSLTDTVTKAMQRTISNTINLVQGFFKMPVKSQTESISLSDASVRRSITRAIWNTIEIADSTIRRTVSKRLTQTITLTDQAVNLFKFALRVLIETITNTDNLKRFIDKRVSETITLTQWFRKAITKGVFSENISLSDWASALKAAFINLSETINLTETLRKAIQTTKTEAVGLADVIQKYTPRVFAQTMTMVDSIRKTISKPFIQSMSLSDNLSRSLDKTLSENITLAESFTKFIPKVFSQTITLTEQFVKYVPKLFTEAISLTEDFRKTTMKRLLETITITQSFFQAYRFVARILSETITLTQQFGKVVMKRFTEGLSSADQLRRNITKAAFQENFTLTDVILPLLGIFRTLQETITNIDSIRKITSTVKTETYSLVDIVTKNVTRTLSEAMTLADQLIEKVKTQFKTLVETISLSDLLIEVQKLMKYISLTETMNLVDSIYRDMTRSFGETMTLISDVTKLTYRRLSQEIITLVEQFSKVFGQLIISGGFRTARFIQRKLSSFFSDR